MRRRASLTVALAAVALAMLPTVARAEFGIAPGGLTVQMLNRDGAPETRAGAHPDRLTMQVSFNRTPDELPDGTLRDLKVAFPPGTIGDPTAAPLCERETLTLAHFEECSPGTQVGTVKIDAGFVVTLPVYNAEPRPGNVAEFGFAWLIVGGYLVAEFDEDGQLVIRIADMLHALPAMAMTVELWGVPADHLSVEVPRRAFLTAPPHCGVAQEVKVDVRSWQEPDVWRRTVTALPQLEGCESMPFDPSLDFALERSTADTPTGAEIRVSLPPEVDPDGLANDRIKDMSLALPDGMTLALGVANGTQSCPEAAVRLGTSDPDDCPPESRVGKLEMRTPLISAPLVGNVYMGGQLPGSDFRLYAVTRAAGLAVKLPITLHADPATGRLTTALEDLPTLPLERMTLTFDGGVRAALVTSLRCGPANATATLTTHGGKRVTVAGGGAVTSAAAGGPCPAVLPFAPSFAAGALRARAGVSSPFAATIRRRDGDQSLARFSMTLPKGASARLADVDRCDEAAIAAGACPQASRIGTAFAEAGAGPAPLALSGELFLTGPHRATRPYRQSPFGVAIVFRGAAGPFDLGTIVVRAGLRLDPRSGQVTIDGDPLPRLVRGIPLRMQTVAIDIDRPGFTSNPTSCVPGQVTARLESTEGTVVERASRFAVGGCHKLRFRPRVAMSLTGRSELRRDGTPGLRMQIRSAAGGANIRSASVAMPSLLTGSPIGPEAICSLRQVEVGRCPTAARIGRASGRSPLVEGALRGSVYLVQPPGKGLPDVWAVLAGQGIQVKVRMRTVVDDDGGMRGELVDLPDMPLTAFTIDFASGKRGMFSAKRAPCLRGQPRAMRTTAHLKAHNGAARKLALRVGAPGCRR